MLMKLTPERTYEWLFQILRTTLFKCGETFFHQSDLFLISLDFLYE